MKTHADFTNPVSLVATIVPMANTVTACIDLYESLVHGEMPEPLEITKVEDGRYDIHVRRESQDCSVRPTKTSMTCTT